MKKRNKKTILALIISALILASVLAINIFSNEASSQFFIDKELGLIEVSSGGGLVPQTFFTKNTAEIGEKVNIEILLKNPYYAWEYSSGKIYIDLNGNTITSLNAIPPSPNNGVRIVSFTPTKAGTYTARFIFSACEKGDGGFTCLTPEKAYKGGDSYYCPNYGDKIVDGVKICSNNKCVLGTPNCVSNMKFESTNSLKVEAEEVIPSCSKKPFTKDWFVLKTISNGQILKTISYEVTSSCNYREVSSKTRTQCDDEYVIPGTSLTMSEGEHNCVSIYNEDDESYDDYLDRDDECNVDSIITCGDGTQITDKVCFEGLLFDTGEECSIIGEPDDTNDETNDDTPTNDDESSNNDDQNPAQDTTIIEENIEVEYFFYLIPLTFLIIISLIVWMKLKKPKRRR